jgi:hypothetical protein
MASNDDDSSSNFFTNDLDQNDTERDLYAILHISKDVRTRKLFLYICFFNKLFFRLIQQQFNKPIVD